MNIELIDLLALNLLFGLLGVTIGIMIERNFGKEKNNDMHRNNIRK